jgi:hypothetical protein
LLAPALSAPEARAKVTTGKAGTATPQRYSGATFGHRYTAPMELWWDDECKPCVVCKEPTHWRRPHKRGAATHHDCEGSVFDTVSDELYADVVYLLARELDVTEMTDVVRAPATPRSTDRPLGDPNAGCSICGRGFSALWIVARLWLCPLHSLMPIRYPWRSA